MNIQTSVIIPSRVDQYLQKTIDDLLQKAEAGIEIIVVMDGYWPDVPVKDDPRVHIIHHGTLHDSIGMREGINRGMSMAKGEFVMKIDEHCMVDQGFDVKLALDCGEHDVVIPRRKRLDPEKWELIHDGRPDIDYMKVDFPFPEGWENDITSGLHGSEWKRPERNSILIDYTPTSQGSCYFMRKSHWDTCIGHLESENYGQFTHESQEIDFKTWFSGGHVIVNKKTWYAHYHKGKKGKGYGFSNKQWDDLKNGNQKGRQYCKDYWLNQHDYLHDWKWFIDQMFPTMPGWEGDWESKIKKAQAN